ncbi:MAG: hypothetical protein F6K19_36455, partial [Cyanothece sp. SIO1E1]|nr:hypothetical protein [Cyanothece sp. SIO1E1]
DIVFSSYGTASSSHRGSYFTPGTLKAFLVSLVKPVAYLRDFSQEFCTKINQTLGVPPNRIYIEFADAQGGMWGWNGSTF